MARIDQLANEPTADCAAAPGDENTHRYLPFVVLTSGGFRGSTYWCSGVLVAPSTPRPRLFVDVVSRLRTAELRSRRRNHQVSGARAGGAENDAPTPGAREVPSTEAKAVPASPRVGRHRYC